MQFKGVDNTHPNTRTQSIVLVQIHHGKAYIISARTYSEKFADRWPLLDGLVRSLTFPGRAASQ